MNIEDSGGLVVGLRPTEYLILTVGEQKIFVQYLKGRPGDIKLRVVAPKDLVKVDRSNYRPKTPVA